MDKKIRILYTIPNFNTAGSGRSIYDLVKGLDRSIFEPEICCNSKKGVFYSEIEKLGVKIHLFPSTVLYKPRKRFVKRVLKTRNFFRENNFDIIHSWHWSSDISEPLAAKLAGIPYVYTKKAMGWGNRYWTWKSKLSSKIIVVNEDMVNMYFSKMLHKIYRFPLAIDTKIYNPSLPKPKIIEGIVINDDDFIILSVANLVEVKGIEILLDSVKQIKNNRIKVIIVGNDTNDYGIKIKEKYKEEKNIFFVGKKLDVKPYLSLANLFVIPTKNEGRREGIPNAPLEAMATECVVLGSRISGIKDILKPFPNCLFEPSNIKDLTEKITFILDMPIEEREMLAKTMRNNVIEEFSIERFLKNHEKLYLEIVS